MNHNTTLLCCSFCGADPVVETKPYFGWPQLSTTIYRYACRNVRCHGHTGRWMFLDYHARRAWNHSQSTKYYTVRNAYRTHAMLAMKGAE